MAGVELEARVCGGYLVVALCGQLDATDAAEIAAVLTAVAGRGRRVIVDLADLEFVDCTGLRALAEARQAARGDGGDLLLAAPAGAVARMLDVTGRAEVLGVHASVAAAAASADRRPAASTDRRPTARQPVPLLLRRGSGGYCR